MEDGRDGMEVETDEEADVRAFNESFTGGVYPRLTALARGAAAKKGFTRETVDSLYVLEAENGFTIATAGETPEAELPALMAWLADVMKHLGPLLGGVGTVFTEDGLN